MLHIHHPRTYRVDTFIFSKPLESVTRQKAGWKDFYYVAKLYDHTKILPQIGRTKAFYQKEEIEKLPKHLRRGGEYIHDEVVIAKDKKWFGNGSVLSQTEKDFQRKHYVNLCKIWNIKVRFVNSTKK